MTYYFYLNVNIFFDKEYYIIKIGLIFTIMINNKQTIEIFKKLIKFDTPTICNALEVIDSKCQNNGYTKKEFFCLNKLLPPMIGFVRTAKIYSNDINQHVTTNEIIKYYRYMEQGNLPKICIVEDINKNPTGCFWGEVQTNIHQNLGFNGIITNGSIRDLDDVARNFQMLAGSVLPSHSFIKLKSIGKRVKIFSEIFNHDDIVHADQHGVVKISYDYLKELPKAINYVVKNEKPILDLCKSSRFSLKKLEIILNDKKKYH